MTILAAFSDLDLSLQALAVLSVLGIVAILGFTACRYDLKFRSRGKSWLIY